MNIRKQPNYRAAPSQKPPPKLPEGRGMDEKANVFNSFTT